MENEMERQLNALDPATLIPLVRQVLNDERIQMIEWQSQPLDGGAGGGVWRLSGTVLDEDSPRSWSLILKVPRQTVGLGDPYGGVREPVVYRSRFLQRQPGGLVAPKCYGVMDGPDDSHWIWLEDIVEEGSAQWSLERYGIAAFHLGRFNGSFLSGQSLPSWPWLDSGAQLRDYVDRFVPPIDPLRDSLSSWQLHHGLSSTSAEQFLQVLAEREAYLDALDELPKTLCHGDADRRNFLSRRMADGREETVAIDWAFAGLGVLGRDIANLVNSAVLFSQIGLADLASLENSAFAAYRSGLKDAGWHGDIQMVRFGYAASTALVSGLVISGALLIRLLDEEWIPLYEEFLGGSIEEIIPRTIALLTYQLELANEAREYVGTIR